MATILSPKEFCPPIANISWHHSLVFMYNHTAPPPLANDVAFVPYWQAVNLKLFKKIIEHTFIKEWGRLSFIYQIFSASSTLLTIFNIITISRRFLEKSCDQSSCNHCNRHSLHHHTREECWNLMQWFSWRENQNEWIHKKCDHIILIYMELDPQLFSSLNVMPQAWSMPRL